LTGDVNRERAPASSRFRVSLSLSLADCSDCVRFFASIVARRLFLKDQTTF
jgi:hypothetical protein